MGCFEVEIFDFKTRRQGQIGDRFPEAGKIIGAIFGVTASCSSSSHWRDATVRYKQTVIGVAWDHPPSFALRAIPAVPGCIFGRVRQS